MNDAQHARPGRKQFRIATAAGMALAGISLSGLVAGQEANWKVHPGLTDQWTLEIGAYSPTVKTTASLNRPTLGVGTTVSFEDDFGLSDRKTMGSVFGRVRLGERWRIEAEYFGLDREGTRSIGRTITWGGNTYAFGTTVTAEFNSDIYRLAGGYSFVKDAQLELGMTLGLHVTDFTTSLAAAGIGRRTGDTLAPLPTIGLYGAYAFTPKWLLSGRLDFFSMSYSDYDGSLSNFTAAVDYRFARNFGVGLGYRYVDYDVSVTKPRFTGNITYKFSGPALYFTGSF